MKSSMLLPCALLSLLLASPVLRAQTTGALSGAVTDVETGKRIAGATIKVLGTSPLRGAVSRSDGSFLIAGIHAGEYDVQVSAVGYKAEKRPKVRIAADQETRLDFRIGLGARTSDTCVVRAQRTPPINIGSTTKTQSISRYDIERSARTSIQSAMAPNSGVTTAGVNGISIRGGRVSETSIRNADGSLSEVHGAGLSGYVDFLSDVANTVTHGDSIAPEPRLSETYDSIIENPFMPVAREKISTFSIDVDAASYTNIRRFAERGSLPPRDAVRIEEMINYFTYDYPQPYGDAPFSITTEVARCPWNAAHELVRIGLQGRRVEMKDLPPNNLVFLIDVSGSMGSPDKLPLLQQGLRLLVGQLRREDRVAIVVYAGEAGQVLPSTSGAEKEKIIRAIESLRPGGSTAGEAGIALAYSMARGSFLAGGNNRVILCTDGDFNVGVTSRDELTAMIERKRGEGIALTVLGFGRGNYNDATMEMLADKGNGNYAYIDGIEEARRVLVSELGATLFTIAKDVKIQAEFNPALVRAYRLIGYENRLLAREDFHDDTKDAGEMGAGHSVTALYEIVPMGAPDDASGPELSGLDGHGAPIRPVGGFGDTLLFVKLRYKPPTDSVSRLLIGPVLGGEGERSNGSDDLRHAAAVAELGMLLRDSKFRGSASYDDAITLARGARGIDADGSRDAFITLAELCRDLAAAASRR